MARPRTTAVEDWDAVAAGSSTHEMSGFDEGVLLRELVAGLEPDRRDAFVLTQVLGLGYAAAAEVCGCPSAPSAPGWPGRARIWSAR